MQDYYDQLKFSLIAGQKLQRTIESNRAYAVNNIGGGREVAMSITNLQQAMMWAQEYAAEVGDLIIE